MIQYYKNITSPENIKVHNAKRDKNREVFTSSKRDLEGQTGEEQGGRSAVMIQASVALQTSRKDPLRSLISYSKVTKVRSLGSGHENPGLSDATLRVHI